MSYKIILDSCGELTDEMQIFIFVACKSLCYDYSIL